MQLHSLRGNRDSLGQWRDYCYEQQEPHVIALLKSALQVTGLFLMDRRARFRSFTEYRKQCGGAK